MTILNLVITFAILQSPPAVGGIGDAEQRFRSEYPTALKALCDAYSDVRGSGSLTHRIQRKGQWITESERFEFAISGASWKLTWIRPESGEANVAYRMTYCTTPGQSFTIRQMKSSDAPELRGVEASADPALRKKIQAYLGPYLYCSITPFGNQDLHGEVNSFLKLDSVDQDGRGLVRVRYDWLDAPNLTKLKIKPKAEILLSPSEGWTVREYTIGQFDKPLSLRRGAIEYGASQKGLPIPRKLTIKSKSDEKVFEFDKLTLGPTPAAEFALENEGFPNLAATPVQRPRTGSGPWFFGAASIAAVLAIGLKILAARSRRAMPGTGGAP